MLQDKNGFIWAGTDGGLNRFDGYEFKAFRNRPFDTSSLGDNAVYFIVEDSLNHNLWVGTRTCLNFFDTRTYNVIRYYNKKTINELSDGKALNRFEWLLAYNTEVYHFDIRNREFSNVPIYDGDTRVMDIDLIENICIDKHGNYFIVGNQGVFVYDSIQKKCVRKAAAPDLNFLNKKTILYFIEDSNGDYWFATIADGIIKYSVDQQEYRKIKLPGDDPEKTIRFDYILEDSYRNIWIAGSSGLFLIDQGVGKISRFIYDANRMDGISHKELNCLLEDKNRGLWVGTAGGGINFFYQENYKFHNISLVNKNREQLSPYVMSLNKGFGNEIWYWCLNGNYGSFLPQWTQTKELLTINENNAFRFATDGSIERLNNDTLIFLNGFSTVKLFPKRQSQNSFVINNSSGVCNVTRLRNGQIIWFVTKPNSDPHLIRDTFYLNFYVYDFKEDRHGHYWLCGPSGMLWYNPDTKKYKIYRHDYKNILSLSSDIIYDIEVDELDNIWIATISGGLNYFDRSTETFRHYSKNEGLLDDIIYAMEKDVNGNLWLSTNHGLSRFNPRTKTFRNFTSKDGLLNMEFNRQASYKNEKGQLFFGGVLGIDFFDPAEISDVKTNNILSFTGFSLFSNDLYPHLWNGEIPVFKLKYNQNYITIRFSAMDFKDAARVQYSYKLNDNNEWITLGNSHSLLLTNLTPGTHLFHIRSTTGNGEWSNAFKTCQIIITPPWWQSWWFQLLVMAAAVLGLSAIYRNRIQQVRKKSSLKQQLQELEMRALKSQMNPHFIYNAMNSIQALVLAKKTEQASLYISKFGRLLRQVLDNSEKSLISLENELQSLELYIQLELLRLNVDLKYRIDVSEKVNVDEEHLPPLIFQPFVENSFWHGLSNKNGEKILNISIQVKDDWLLATIEDNGIGRTAAMTLNQTKHTINKSKGIEITSKRLTEHNKSMGISPVEVIDLYNEYRKAAGTRILVKIKRSVQP
jgi:ligand-binding sensor domain-containing protein